MTSADELERKKRELAEMEIERERLDLERQRLELERQRLEFEAVKIESGKHQAAPKSKKPKSPARRTGRLSTSGRHRASKKGTKAPAARKKRASNNTLAIGVAGAFLAAASVGALLVFFGDKKKLGLEEKTLAKTDQAIGESENVKFVEALEKAAQRERAAKEVARKRRAKEERAKLRERERLRRERIKAEERLLEKRAALALKREHELERHRTKVAKKIAELAEVYEENPNVARFCKYRSAVEVLLDDRRLPEALKTATRRNIDQARKALAWPIVGAIRDLANVAKPPDLLRRIKLLEDMSFALPKDIAEIKKRALGEKPAPKPKTEPKAGPPKKAKDRKTSADPKLAKLQRQVELRVRAWMRLRTVGVLRCVRCKGTQIVTCPGCSGRGVNYVYMTDGTVRTYTCNTCRGNRRIRCPNRTCLSGYRSHAIKRAIWDHLSPAARKGRKRKKFFRQVLAGDDLGVDYGKTLAVRSSRVLQVEIQRDRVVVTALVGWNRERQGEALPEPVEWESVWFRVRGQFYLLSETDTPEKLW